jgi:hypothetical protein
MDVIVKESNGYRPAVLRGLMGYNTTPVVVLLRECRPYETTYGRNDEAQAMSSLDLAGHEGEVTEIIGQRLDRSDQPGGTRSLSISRPYGIRTQSNHATVQVDLMNGCVKIGVRTVDR